jgi:leucyl-tRNA synthetase
MVPTGADRDALEQAARAEPRVAELIQGRDIKKLVVVPGKLVNFVVAG